jgi:hypothetical protein
MHTQVLTKVRLMPLVARVSEQRCSSEASCPGSGRVVPKYRSDGPVRGLVEKAFRFPGLVGSKNRPLQFFLFLLPLQSIPSPLP